MVCARIGAKVAMYSPIKVVHKVRHDKLAYVVVCFFLLSFGFFHLVPTVSDESPSLSASLCFMSWNVRQTVDVIGSLADESNDKTVLHAPLFPGLIMRVCRATIASQ